MLHIWGSGKFTIQARATGLLQAYSLGDLLIEYVIRFVLALIVSEWQPLQVRVFLGWASSCSMRQVPGSTPGSGVVFILLVEFN